MEVDEVLYSHLMADPLMILPPKGFPSLVRSSDKLWSQFWKFHTVGWYSTWVGVGDADSALLGAQLELELTGLKWKKPVAKDGVRAMNFGWIRLALQLHCPQRAAFSYTGHCLNFTQKRFPRPGVCWLSTTWEPQDARNFKKEKSQRWQAKKQLATSLSRLGIYILYF